MILDAQLQFSSAQAITAAAASTNAIDLGVASRDIGTGQPLFVVVTIDTTMTDASSDSTLDVILYGDSTTTFTPDASQTLFTIPAVSTAGSTFIASLDPTSAPLQYQYIELYYSPNNGNLTTGAFSAYLTNNIENVNYYASGYTITTS